MSTCLSFVDLLRHHTICDLLYAKHLVRSIEMVNVLTLGGNYMYVLPPVALRNCVFRNRDRMFLSNDSHGKQRLFPGNNFYSLVFITDRDPVLREAGTAVLRTF
jgi:hypothetical protein